MVLINNSMRYSSVSLSISFSRDGKPESQSPRQALCLLCSKATSIPTSNPALSLFLPRLLLLYQALALDYNLCFLFFSPLPHWHASSRLSRVLTPARGYITQPSARHYDPISRCLALRTGTPLRFRGYMYLPETY